MDLSVGKLIWTAVRPILKLALVAAGGLALSRAGILTASASKNLSKIIVCLLVPCLIFANMSSSLSLDNLRQLGLARITTYMSCHLFMRVIADSGGRLGQLVFNATLFPLGGYRFIQKDFQKLYDEEVVEAGVSMRLSQSNESVKDLADAVDKIITPVGSETLAVDQISLATATLEHEYQPASQNASTTPNNDHSAGLPVYSDESSLASYVAPAVVNSRDSSVGLSAPPSVSTKGKPSSAASRTGGATYSRLGLWLAKARYFLMVFVSPVNLSVLLGLIIAFIPTLKRLFIYSARADGSEPPLAFVYEVASFIGAGSVPLSVANLGAALAKLQMRSAHPPSAIALTVFKLIITPLIAVFAFDPLLTSVLGW
ncbi:hypothetical protein THASP1DRAFT_26921, partial [Thamnocephalis sphaerospora]